jgi:transcriptional regulator with XRE-family HTH domain
MKLGEYIKLLRNEARLGQEDIADKAKVHRNTLTNLEKGEGIRFDNLRKILNVLELDEKQWSRAASLWVREELGEADFARFAIPEAARDLIVREQEDLSDDARRLSQKLVGVDEQTRLEIIRAVDHPEIVECIRILNAFHQRATTGSDVRVFERPESSTPPRLGRAGVSYSSGKGKKRPPRKSGRPR